jgi:hydrogenase expression/formation protein HypD
MKYVDECRDGEAAKFLAERIAFRARDRQYRLMEFCGGHTHAIFRYGLSDLLPPSIRLIHGPGCPMCVLPMGRIDGAIALSKKKEVILATYADMMRVPASNGRASTRPGRMVYSAMDALRIAREHPGKDVVFFAIGFETTMPPTALAIRQAKSEGLSNFSVYIAGFEPLDVMQSISMLVDQINSGIIKVENEYSKGGSRVLLADWGRLA